MPALAVSPPIQVSANEYEFLRLQKDVGSEIILNIRQILRDEDINFTEDLANSFSLVMWMGKAHIESSNRYAGLVDRGMKPGKWVNYDALHDWVVIKLGIDDPEAVNVTWKILKKIQRDGIRPKRYVKKALKMVIGKHGVATLRRKTGNKRKRKSRIMKTVGKINKAIRAVKRILRKIDNIQRSIKSPLFAVQWNKRVKQKKARRISRAGGNNP